MIFVGVDVGKGHHHAVALDRNGEHLFNKAQPNDEAKLRAFINELKAHGQPRLSSINLPPSARCLWRSPVMKTS